MTELAQQEFPDRRGEPRDRADLAGRYMLSDHREYDGEVLEVALGSVTIKGPKTGEIGDRVIMYIDQLGRIEGNIKRHTEDGFALELTLSPAAANKWAERIANLDPQAHQLAAEQREALRAKPEEDTRSRMTLPDGRSYPCEVIDVSISGAAIKVGVFPAIGTPVQLGKMRGKIVRHLPQGVAIEFVSAGHGSLADRLSSVQV